MVGVIFSNQLLRAAVDRPLACIVAAALALSTGCARPLPSVEDGDAGRDPSPANVAPADSAPSAELPPPGQASAGDRADAADAARRSLVLLGTTDIHGYVYPYDYYAHRETGYGLARLAPLVDSVRRANPGRVFLFDSGDLLQGNPLAFVHSPRYEGDGPWRGPAVGSARAGDESHPVIRAMDLMGYDAAAVGNHEFNYGLDHLGRAVDQAAFPFLSANIFEAGTDRQAYRPSVLLPHAVAEGDTILVGVTGNTPPGVHLWDRDNVEGRLELRDVVTSVRGVVRRLRARGADLVVVLSHGGLEGTSYDTAATGLPPENDAARLAREVPGIDVILLGHTHRELADTTINGVLLAQAKNWAGSLAAVRVEMTRRGPGDWTVASRDGALLRPEPVRADTALLDSLRWAHERAVAYVSSVIGRAAERMDAHEARVGDTPILDFVNEVQRRAADADLSATAAFNLDAALPAGELTVADIAGLYVYDNTLKAVRITGGQLRAFLEKSAEYYCGWPACATVTDFDVPGYNFDVVTGVDYTLDLTRPVGERVTELRYQGEPVDPGRTFTMALNNYRQSGGGGYSMLPDLPVVHDRQEDIRSLLIEEVERRGTIDPDAYYRDNWRLAPAEAAGAAKTEQLERLLRRSAGPSRTDTSVGRRVRVIATTDFHGRLLPRRYDWSEGRAVGGAATLAAYLAAERAGHRGPTLLLDGGDILQGSPLSNLTDGRSSIDYYDRAGYAAAALGNHEFDWGIDVLRERIRQARFPMLAANVFVEGADTAPSWTRATTLLDLEGGPTVGVIGLALPATPAVTKSRNVAGLEFRAMAPAVDRWVPRLRERGADIVIAVAHAGAICSDDGGGRQCEGDIIELARTVRQPPDLIVGGHTHRTVQRRVSGIPIVQAAAYGTRYAVVDLLAADPAADSARERDRAQAPDAPTPRDPADSSAGSGVRAWIRGAPTTYADRVRPDSAVAALVARYQAEIGPQVDEVVATLAEPLRRRPPERPDGDAASSAGAAPPAYEHGLGRLIADAQRRATGAHVAIMNNGGIRSGLAEGPVTWGELYRVQPFRNELVRLRLTGGQLRAALERALVGDRPPDVHVSGIVVWYEPSRPSGDRIVALELTDGRPVRYDRVYTVTVNDFMADPGREDGVFRHALTREATGITDLDALVDHLEARPGPVRAPDASRFRPLGPSRSVPTDGHPPGPAASEPGGAGLRADPGARAGGVHGRS